MQRVGHGLVPVLVPVQFLPVAGDEQQRVVGGDAEDEDGQDAGALPVDGEVRVLGEQVHRRLGEAQGEDGAQYRDEPEDGAPVDEEQQDDDDEAGGHEQEAVEALEDLELVGATAGGAGDVGGQAGRSAVGEVARVVDRGDQVDVRQRHQRLEGLAVLGREGALRLLGARQFLERGGVRAAFALSAGVMPPDRS